MTRRTRFSRTSPQSAVTAIHSLEARRLFASAALSGTQLLLTGNGNTANAITLTLSSDKSTYSANVSGVKKTFAASAVKSVKVAGGTQSDSITFGTTVSLPSTILPGNGNDTVYGGAGNDTVTDPSGGNKFYLRGGNDSVSGGAGNDTIDGGDGNDTLLGNGGIDLIYGGSGDDLIDAGAGTDSVDGGNGTDTAINAEKRVSIEKTSTGGTTTPTAPTSPTSPTAPGGNVPTSSAAATPTAVISAIDSTITAGQAVFVSALNTRVANGSADTARFQWDFGDTGSAYNTLVGFNAGHVYAKAGTYTLTLKVWNEKSGYDAASLTIRVAPASRSTIYVSSAGSDSNNGASSGSAVKTFARAAALANGKSSVDVLFRSGDTFGTTSTFEISGQNVRLGSYGTGSKPVIKWNGARDSSDIVHVKAEAVGTIVENLTIDSRFVGPESSRTGMPFAIDVKGTSTAVRDITFLNVGYGVQTNAKPTGVLVQDCDSPTLYGLRSYLVWAQGSDFVLLGNKVANSTAEHPVRVYGVDRMLIAYNDFANPQAYSFETSKTALNIQKGTYVYVYDNMIRGPRWQVGPLGGADGVDDKAGRLSHVVLENNTILNTLIQVVHGVSDVYVRNNVFKFDNTNAMEIDGYNAEYNRNVQNLNVANNTFINSGTKGRVLSVEGAVAGITLVNNLYQANDMYVGTYGTAAVYVNDSSLRSFNKISNNIWPVPNVSNWVAANVPGGSPFAIIGSDLNDLDNYLSLAKWNNLSQVGTDMQADVSLSSTYAPTSSSSLVSDGIEKVAGVFTDYDNDARPLGDEWTIGAIQQ